MSTDRPVTFRSAEHKRATVIVHPNPRAVGVGIDWFFDIDLLPLTAPEARAMAAALIAAATAIETHAAVQLTAEEMDPLFDLEPHA